MPILLGLISLKFEIVCLGFIRKTGSIGDPKLEKGKILRDCRIKKMEKATTISCGTVALKKEKEITRSCGTVTLKKEKATTKSCGTVALQKRESNNKMVLV